MPRRGRQQERARRRERLLIGGPIAVIAAAAAAFIWAAGNGSPGPGSAAGGGGPFLAGLASMAQGGTVGAVQCDISEQSLYHIHAHLAVYVNGSPRQIPASVGIPGARPAAPDAGRCLYWLHTHDQTGVIHIESPVPATFTLGDFFGIWGQPLSAGQAGAARGKLTAYVGGARYTGDPRAIPLRPGAVIQFDIGTAVPPRPYTFPPGL